MSRPAGNAAHGENRRIEFHRNPEHVISRSGVEIHVGVNLLFADHKLFESARSTDLISRSILITRSLAPPWSGPFSVPIAEVMAECISESVEAVTRAAKVEALKLWSACRISATSKQRASSALGTWPLSM